MRLKPVAMGYLRRIPQFAYVEGRSLQQAVERTIAHCAVVRALLAQQSNSLFAKRQGRVLRGIVGGIQLSLDITKAYDCVERGDLKLALQEAGNPSDLASAILAIHHQAQLRVRHGDEQADLPLRKGLRQGCSLSPLLWAVFSGWVMGRLEAADSAAHSGLATAFADDLHYSWVIKSGADLEAAYNRIMAILTHLKAHKLQVSVDKTVLIVELRGPKAQDILRKYVVEKAQGPHMRFRIHGEHIDVKIVQQHVYLGICLSYRKFEQETVRRRVQLAKSQFSRLRSILKCQAVPLPLRLRLWKACVPPCLLHGLDCTGIPAAEIKQVTVLLVKQARSVARSHSMFTRETNAQFMHRLQLQLPVDSTAAALAHRLRLDCLLDQALQPSAAQL